MALVIRSTDSLLGICACGITEILLRINGFLKMGWWLFLGIS
jgi:hypothetical protein